MISFEQAESEYNKDYMPYDKVDFSCENCGEDKIEGKYEFYCPECQGEEA